MSAISFGRAFDGEELKSVCSIELSMMNRHGFITGATGTGKTVTLRVLAEQLSDAGVPVFLTDVKGDLASLAVADPGNTKMAARAQMLGIEDYQSRAYPVVPWDTFGERGTWLRATVTDFGPLLLSRLFELNETQSDVLQIVFAIADDELLPLLDTKDLRSFLGFLIENSSEYQARYGALASRSLAAILRRVVALEEEALRATSASDETEKSNEAEAPPVLFGEPMLDVLELLKTTAEGRGLIHVLSAERLYRSPRNYSATLLWILSELFENLPEVGDSSRPRLVLFIDEAHLLFRDSSKVLIEKIEAVVRLIRSKGVGVFFVTQSPSDIPERVLAQLGNRIQHALRAYTPSEQKALRAAANSFRSDGSFPVERTIQELAVGEALVSVLEKEGVPSVAQRVKVYPPRSRLGTIGEGDYRRLRQSSQYAIHYDRHIDRESAYELLIKRSEQNESAEVKSRNKDSQGEFTSAIWSVIGKALGSAARSIGTQVGRAIIRGVLGSPRRFR